MSIQICTPNSHRALHLKNPAAIFFSPFTVDVVYVQGRIILSIVLRGVIWACLSVEMTLC